MKIVHIEDEPAIAYAQIAAEGLKLGQTIRILKKSPERYILTDGEIEYRLAPAVAANITAIAAADRSPAPLGLLSLSDLKHGQKAEIVSLDDSVQGFTRRRFLDLGLTPGTIIAPELKNFFGDPRGYRVRGTLIALRKEQAAKIFIKTAVTWNFHPSPIQVVEVTMTTPTKVQLPTDHCETCPAYTQLEQMGLKIDNFDRVIALAGNPNTGKSTLFNSLDRA